MKKISIVCPLCEGSGYLEKKIKFKYPFETIKKAFDLRKEGYPLRAIAIKLNINPPYPQKVVSLIKTYGNYLLEQEMKLKLKE